MRPEVRIFSDGESLAEAAAGLLVEITRKAAAARGRCSIALSGGRTPQGLYERMAERGGEIHWPSLHLFWGDERCVPPGHPESNFRMVREALLARAPIPPDNVHRIQGERRPEEAAELYEEELRTFFGPEQAFPALDLVLLGLGTDGHTASLFPGSDALRERVRWVTVAAAPEGVSPPVRVTLTLPSLNAASAILFLVSGAEKAPAVSAILGDEPGAGRFPASRVSPEGRLLWYLDRDAGATLMRGGKR